MEGGKYHVRLRLADSLPQKTLKILEIEKEDLIQLQESSKELSSYDRKRMQFLRSEKVEKFLDAGYGACYLQQDTIANLIAEALRRFDGIKYHLHAWCIMPNHVHMIIEPLSGHPLPRTMRAFKSYTARMANRILKRRGSFWQREYFDHLIRNDERMKNTIDYIWKNSEVAGLQDWKWRWKKE